MEHRSVSEQIIKGVGGKENIGMLTHCTTRLRFNLIENTKADLDALSKIDGVVGVTQNVQTQVIIGNEVNEVYDIVTQLIGDVSENQNATAQEDQGLIAKLLDFVVVFLQPIVPAIAGGGVLKSILLLFSLFNLINPEGSTYQILNYIGDAALYFLPLLVSITTARKLRVHELVAVATTGALLLPRLSTMLQEGTTLFTLSVPHIE